jgi:26S proteasome regulatory subunit N1
MVLVDFIVPYNMAHNCEPEAVDLLMEVEAMSKLADLTTEDNYNRVCNYLLSCSDFAADAEEMTSAFKAAFDIYMKN